MDTTLRIALLIDADNASFSTLDYVLGEIANLGIANVRRAYGDWGSGYLQGWRSVLLDNAIQPVQQIAYANKGNASDMAMTVDAMDLLYSDRFDAFALMSSDSDFTPLVMRLRAANMKVYGFGKSNTPSAFKSACSTFFYVDSIDEPALQAASVAEEAPTIEAPKQRPRAQTAEEATIISGDTAKKTIESALAAPIKPLQKAEPPAQAPRKKTGVELRGDTRLINLLRSATSATKDDQGWSNLGAVAKYIANLGPFTSKNYGYGTIKSLIVATELFQVGADGNHIKALAPKNAKKKKAKPAT